MRGDQRPAQARHSGNSSTPELQTRGEQLLPVIANDANKIPGADYSLVDSLVAISCTGSQIGVEAHGRSGIMGKAN